MIEVLAVAPNFGAEEAIQQKSRPLMPAFFVW